MQEDEAVLDQVIRAVGHNPNALRRLYGSGFAPSYARLDGLPPMPGNHSFLEEARWAVAILGTQGARLTEFVRLESEFGNAVVTGDWRQARSLLEAVRARFGVSHWLVEAELLVSQRSGGIEANKEASKRIIDELPDPLGKVLTSFVSTKVEEGLSRGNYERELKVLRISLEGKFGRLIYALFRMRVDRYEGSGYDADELAFILHQTSAYGPIDWYLAVIHALQWLACTPNAEGAADGSALAAKLSRSVADKRLVRLAWGDDPTHGDQSDTATAELIPIVDAYTAGDYRRVGAESAAYLHRHPGVFEAYELLAKSEQLGRIVPVLVFPAGSVGAEVLDIVRRVVSRSDDGWLTRGRVEQYALSVQLTPLGPQTLAFVLAEVQQPPRWGLQTYRLLTAQAATPRLAMGLLGQAERLRYLDSWRVAFGDGITWRLFHAVASGAQLGSGLAAELPPERRHKYAAALMVEGGDLAGAAAVYHTLRREMAGSPSFASYVTNKLFKLLLELGDLDECALLVADTYLENPNLLVGVRIQDAAEAVKARGWTAAPVSLAKVILYYLTQDTASQKERRRILYRLYQSYLGTLGVDRPSRLETPTDGPGLARFVFFLDRICVTDVIDSSLAFRSSEALEEERIEICQRLIQVDHQRSERYTAEIAQILKAKAVRQAINRVGQGKVYVDVAGLVRSLDKPYRELFDRYQQIRRLKGELRVVFQVAGAKGEDNLTLLIVDDSSFGLFRELFVELRNRFLWSSEFGLDSYLSVRIRHGTLSGEIRSQFEKYNLVTRKPTETAEYSPNTHWHAVLSGGEPGTIDRVDAILQRFSKSVDETIAEVKDKWVQIVTDDTRPQGLFDYRYSQKDIELLIWDHGATKDYDKFINDIIGELWNRTSTVLETVRMTITTRLTERFTSLLTALEQDIRQVADGPHAGDLLGSIVRCQTTIQNELKSLSGWFSLPDVTDVPDFSLQLAVDTSLAITRRTFPNETLHVETGLDVPMLCPGEYLRPMIDVLRNLLENIVKYGDPADRSTSLRITYDFGQLDLRIRNRLPAGADVMALRADMASRCQRCNDSADGLPVRGEGGTGFFKVMKLVKYDMRSSPATLLIDVDDSRWFEVRLAASLGSGL